MDVISLTSGRCLRAFLCVTTISLAAACASSSPLPSSASGSAATPSANIITAAEIERVNVQNAYEVVRKLRPAMLRQRQVASANGQGGIGKGAPALTGTAVVSGQVVIYVDGTRLGDIEQLREISAPSVGAVRYYSASEAQLKWGSGHPGGVIEVTTKR